MFLYYLLETNFIVTCGLTVRVKLASHKLWMHTHSVQAS